MKEPMNTQSASSNDIATSSRARFRWVVRGVIGIIIFLFLLWIIYGVLSSTMQPSNNVPQGTAPADNNLPASLSDQIDGHTKQSGENESNSATTSDSHSGTKNDNNANNKGGTEQIQKSDKPMDATSREISPTTN